METPAQPQQFQTSASKLRFKAQPQETCEIVQFLNFQTSTIENLNFDQSWEPSIWILVKIRIFVTVCVHALKNWAFLVVCILKHESAMNWNDWMKNHEWDKYGTKQRINEPFCS